MSDLSMDILPPQLATIEPEDSSLYRYFDRHERKIDAAPWPGRKIAFLLFMILCGILIAVSIGFTMDPRSSISDGILVTVSVMITIAYLIWVFDQWYGLPWTIWKWKRSDREERARLSEEIEKWNRRVEAFNAWLDRHEPNGDFPAALIRSLWNTYREIAEERPLLAERRP